MNEQAQNVLTGGSAPWRWQRGMKRDTARLNALDRAAAWIVPFISMPTALREGSILGDCFASMLAGTEHATGAEPAARLRSRPRFTGPLESEAGQRRAGNNEHAPATQRTVKFSLRHETQPAPNELPRQADQELLRRLADVSPASSRIRSRHSYPASTRLHATQQHLFQQISDVASTRDASVTRDASAPEHAPFEPAHETLEASQRSWQDELVRRIKRVISQAKPPQIEAASPEQDLLTAWPWSTSFGGPTAPFELLDYLSNPTRLDRAASNRNGRTRATARSLSKEQKNGAPEEFRNRASTGAQPAANFFANDSWPDARPRETSNAFDNRSSLGDERLTPSAQARENAQGAEDSRKITGSTATRTRGHDFPSTAGSLSPNHPAQVKPSWSEFWEPLRPPEDNFDPRMEEDPSTSGWARQIEPPTTAPKLPPLIPPQMVGMPVLPVAAAAARHGARAEDTADEDLDVLAARIKRILDEEARRHGIDV
jgi:hypothetical protein